MHLLFSAVPAVALVVLLGSVPDALARGDGPGAGPQGREAAGSPACAPGEGKPLPAAFGLSFCSGTARIEIRSIPGVHEGARVASVEAGSPAHHQGFRAGDVVYQVAGRRVDEGEAAAQALLKLRRSDGAVLNFWRDGHPFLIRLHGE